MSLASDNKSHPFPISASVSRRMEEQRRRDTAPEILLRRVLHKRGHRYRVSYPVPGMPRRTIDIAFPGRKVAVFVDGCFWHGCPEHGVRPTHNAEWWRVKLAGNKTRDDETTAHLQENGWVVVRVWEHEEPISALGEIEMILRSKSVSTGKLGQGTANANI